MSVVHGTDCTREFTSLCFRFDENSVLRCEIARKNMYIKQPAEQMPEVSNKRMRTGPSGPGPSLGECCPMSHACYCYTHKLHAAYGVWYVWGGVCIQEPAEQMPESNKRMRTGPSAHLWVSAVVCDMFGPAIAGTYSPSHLLVFLPASCVT